MTQTSTVVVSGGGTGIGRAVARRLHADGRQVTVVGRRTEPLEKLAAELPGLDYVTADLATPEGAEAVAGHIAGCAGVVASAGGLSPEAAPGSPLAAIRDSWQSCFDANVLTSVLLVEAVRDKLAQESGRVVLLSSVAALRGSGGGPYGAMKAALHGWLYDLARELGASGGTANAVAPGFVPDTEFWEGRLTDEVVARRAAQTLVGRPGTPEEIASLTAWLLGPEGGWVTGQILSPNGGAVLGR